MPFLGDVSPNLLLEKLPVVIPESGSATCRGGAVTKLEKKNHSPGKFFVIFCLYVCFSVTFVQRGGSLVGWYLV